MLKALQHTYHRYQTLRTHKITALPIAILMPHSACNCRCVMCDIWKDNKNLKQLNEDDFKSMFATFQKLGTKMVVMSGGEALLNKNFFALCAMLRAKGIKISLLSTGLLLEKNAQEIVNHIDDVIISLDGDEMLHDAIRNIPGAFAKMRTGVVAIHKLKSSFRITGRSVIHKLNFRAWPAIIKAAGDIGLQQISFLPADVSSTAFNRNNPWDGDRQMDVLVAKEDLPDLKDILEEIITDFKPLFENRFIAESPQKLMNIHQYYNAVYGLAEFPQKKCNPPWVSAVVEADGEVRPCFFHASVGNIRQQPLDEILNGEKAFNFRQQLDMDVDNTCKRCVCYLNLHPRVNP